MCLYLYHFMFHITVTSQSAWWCLKSPVSRLFTQQVFEAQIKENIKAPTHWPLCVCRVGVIHWWPVDSPSNRPVTREVFPIDDVIMKQYKSDTVKQRRQQWKFKNWIVRSVVNEILNWYPVFSTPYSMIIQWALRMIQLQAGFSWPVWLVNRTLSQMLTCYSAVGWIGEISVPCAYAILVSKPTVR